jgi:DNA polymerase III subunit delta'
MEAIEHQMDTIAGHGLIKDLVKKMDEGGTLPHAMLFHGPPGIGKKSFAYALAKYVNCTGEKGAEACRCSACSKISRETYLDISILQPEGNRVIKIEKIREVQDRAYLTPVEARKKFVLFLDAERMSRNAANCILKILEEPPKHLVMILTTSNPHNLLPTIRSRCMSFRFSPVPTGEIINWLMKTYDIKDTAAEVAAVLSEGRPGPALEIAEGSFQERREKMIRELDLLSQHGFPAVFRISDKIIEGAGNLATALNDMLIWQRDLLVNKLVPDDENLLVNRDLFSDIRQRSERFSVEGLSEVFQGLLDKQKLAHRFINNHVVLLNLLIEMGSSLKKR